MFTTQDRPRAPWEAPIPLRAPAVHTVPRAFWAIGVLSVLVALLVGSVLPSSSTLQAPLQAQGTSLSPWTEGSLPATAPFVVSTYPGNCSANLSPWTNLSVRFSQPMDPSSTTSAFSISPPVAGTSSVISHTYLNWTLSAPLDYGTTYLVHVATSARSASGLPLSSAWTSQFSTELASTTSTPQVSATCPTEGARGIPLNASVVLSFDLPMNPSSLEGNFSIVPAVVGGQPGAGGYTLSWAHAHLFQANTTYRVEVSTAAESLLGVHLSRPVELNFTTGPAPGSGTSPTGGSGRSSGPTLLELAEAASVGAAVVAVCVVATYAVLRGRREKGAEPSPSGSSEKPKNPSKEEGTTEEAAPEGQGEAGPAEEEGEPVDHSSVEEDAPTGAGPGPRPGPHDPA